MDSKACKLCGATQYRVVYDVNLKPPQAPVAYKITDLSETLYFRIAECLRCGLVYALDHPDEKTIDASYENMIDEMYLQEEKGRRLSARTILKKIYKLKKHGKLLEVGCATGFLLDEARKMNYDVEGLEMSRWAVEFAQKKLNLSVSYGSIEKAAFQYNHYDVIVMTDVIEHLSSPLDVLIKLRQALKPNGVLCVVTPDVNSNLSKFLKARWWGIKNSHLVYFSKKTMADMLHRSGFKITKIKSHPRNFSIQYLLSRLEFYDTFWSKFSKAALKILPKDMMVTFDFYDQLEFFIQKRRSLEFVDQDEKSYLSFAQMKAKTIVTLPAYNAAQTLKRTVEDIPKDDIDDIILVDDGSTDDTVSVAKSLGLKVFVHDKNKGYGANQKTCYKKALELGADIVVMVHPDYQYDPKIIPELIRPITEGRADAVFGSRMMKGGSLEGGMPLWKHNANILLTALENIILKTYLTEYHSGFRAYSTKLLKSIPFEDNSDKFLFDTEIIVQSLLHNFKIEEIPIKTRYFAEASSINFVLCLGYGFGIIGVMLKYILHENNIWKFRQFE